MALSSASLRSVWWALPTANGGLHAPISQEGALTVLISSYLKRPALSALASIGSASALAYKGAHI